MIKDELKKTLIESVVGVFAFLSCYAAIMCC